MTAENADTVALSRVEMPATPLVISSEDVARYGARVSVHLLDKSKYSGTLEWFSISQQMIVLRIVKPGGEEDYSQTQFSNIARMIFTEAMPLQPEPEKTFSIPAAKPPGKHRPFSITLHNDEIIKGELRSYIEDDIGLHLFQSTPGEKIVRMFVPSASIKEHIIGDFFGESLLKKDVINKDQLDQGLAKQKALRNKKLGDYLEQDAIISKQQLEAVISQQQAQPGRKLGEILIEEGMISVEQLQQALTRQKQDRTRLLGSILEEMGAVNEDDIALVAADKVGIPVIHLRKFDIDPGVSDLIPEDIASKHLLMPLCLIDKRLAVASRSVLDTELQNTLRFLTGHEVELYVAGSEDIRWAIQTHYKAKTAAPPEEGITRPASETPVPSEPEKVPTASEAELQSQPSGRQAPMARLLQNVLGEALSRNASDIHVRPTAEHLELQYRIDGTLFNVRTLAKTLQPKFTAHVKSLAGMDTGASSVPQEGRCQLDIEDTTVDLRISAIPSVSGESIVLRIVDTKLQTIGINDLGLSDHDRESLEGVLQKSSGMILVTGSTGSGITTSLYAMINKIKESPIKIITVEDPVEQHLTGIEQVEVNKDSGFTTSVAMHSILHHYPDAIMISEIRDRECAGITIENASSGHIILSSMHTNSAATTISRLLGMGVEPYLLQSLPLTIMSQRLVRKNCPHCMKKEETDPKIRELLKLGDDEVFYTGQGCQACGGTGYHGRILVYELLVTNARIAELISRGVDSIQIHQAAIEDGMVPLVENALSKARDKLTSLDEIRRTCLG